MEKNKKEQYQTVYIVTLVMLVFSLFFLLFGITFAVYQNFAKGTTENIIEAGTVYFSYNEDEFQGNGVNMYDAYPISDNTGKLLRGSSEFFDFSITGKSTISNLLYRVLVVKQDNSTLPDNWVKIYVTTKDGETETPSPLVLKDDRVLTYEELEEDVSGQGKVTFIGRVPKSSEEYHQNFRLRLWVSDQVNVMTDDYGKKEFSVKVKIMANEES